MADDKIKLLEQRLTRLEAALSQRAGGTGGAGGAGGAGGFTSPGGTIVDPAPWGGGYQFYPRPWRPRWPPYVDPAPWPPYVSDPAPWPPYIADPAPWPPGTVSDPAPWGGTFSDAITARTLGRIGHVGDPAPFDISRLSVSQLESTLHSINAERARLDSMESMVKKHLETAKQQKG